MFRVFIYRQTRNLGDAIQTIALSRLLGKRCKGIYRDDPIPSHGSEFPLVANGWLGYSPPNPATPALFAGVHIARHHGQFAEWMRQNPQPIGTRDTYTSGILQGIVATEMVGCATFTFERYTGPRKGRYTVDSFPVPRTTALTHAIGDLAWDQQWELGLQQLDLLRRAAVVYTSRLHVVLPCLAFGTPVVFPLRCLSGIAERERLTLLSDIGFVFDQPNTMDVSVFANRYVTHLERLVGPLKTAKRLIMPEPPPHLRSGRAKNPCNNTKH